MQTVTTIGLDIAPVKKVCKLPNGSEQTWRARPDVGVGSKACLIPPGWCLS
jgi:hypothetical protein